MKRLKLACPLFFIALILVISAPTVLAQTLSTETIVSSQYGPNCHNFGGTGSTCVGGSTVEFVYPPLADTVTFNGAASAIASYGSLGASSMAFGTCNILTGGVNCYNQDIGTSTADASFTDLINISNAPTIGTLAFTFQTSGLYTVICSGVVDGTVCNGNDARADLLAPGDGVTNEQDLILPSGVHTENLYFGFNASFGGLIPIQFNLLTEATCGQSDFTSCSITSNFLDTATVTGLSLFDSSGNLVPNATFSAASGTNYNAIPLAPTPEPSSVLIFGSGLFGIMFFMRKRLFA